MRFTDIGQQLRAYRLESGLRAEEIAARLGVSRAALYRYEKGEVIKLDTIQRLAELLKISPLSLLGIGVEYYNRTVAFLERQRQVEETADQLLLLEGGLCYLITTDAFDAALESAWSDAADHGGADRMPLRTSAEQALGLLAARKRQYALRRPNVICMMALSRVRAILAIGIGPTLPTSDRVRAQCRAAARGEVEALERLMRAEPMGVQLGLLPTGEPAGTFGLFRARDRATLAINPFPPDSPAGVAGGVAMITGAEEAIAAHQRVAEAQWRDALKGAAAADMLVELLEQTPG